MTTLVTRKQALLKQALLGKINYVGLLIPKYLEKELEVLNIKPNKYNTYSSSLLSYSTKPETTLQLIKSCLTTAPTLQTKELIKLICSKEQLLKTPKALESEIKERKEINKLKIELIASQLGANKYEDLLSSFKSSLKQYSLERSLLLIGQIIYLQKEKVNDV